ncbi:MAG: NifB/NifX family molybdenum-iron cluster-binding protein [Candidatus Izemoplasmatales bacterium]|jgi:predicted Fe-Mo cluster-binding NifX family protein|nr:NifB/NifX family molybdenum-iron cluster-binding protein [Candidatus Izemoplasmatales bacterium]MDD4354557.1 NifB/NifX family molybdenum-iron cluster-binding protein [Candidatus Izemoplasmatales bacterium]MDD4988785.1 NifB/NifX family molybdenum-iron cluster-binding protein [Candidatus Izemoplasmatales bacterium]MDD5601615.1 NifB/NifX family molybdenum-iron cluster-binding protein [Candidatus Izemoplasmatales bacterium]MDY0372734.1 NifB/NifX family molybdenum-iron cluster-binding protein [Ca
MIIAMPVTSPDSNALLYHSFGRAPFFVFYDLNTDSMRFVTNEATTTQGGAGIKAAQIIVDNHANCLFTPQCGENSVSVLIGAKIIIYRSIPGTIANNVHAFKSEKLELLHETHTGFHGHQG